ncbi:hypothetical protein HDU83_008519 [Entophlyctis luteolus]|nr:hypothetical protein HDU83_008519 [Entophlyctis luteolus]
MPLRFSPPPGGNASSPPAPPAAATGLEARRDEAGQAVTANHQLHSTAITTIATAAFATSMYGGGVYSGSGSGGSGRATRQQQQALEVVFRENPLPNGVMHHAIATRLGMTRKAVRNWFQNSRAKVRRLAQQGDADAAAMLQTINDMQKQRISEPYSLDWQRQQEESSLFGGQSDLVLVRPPTVLEVRIQPPPQPPPQLQSIPSPQIMKTPTATTQKPYVMSVDALI